MWYFVMRAGTKLDLYARGNERILVNRHTKGIELYYLYERDVLVF